MEFKHTEISNGLKVIAEVNPAAASMAVGFFARTGSRDETHDIAGVSHFLEHMMFKGTERRSPFDINREFDEMGALYNAFTSEENTVYFAGVLPEFQTKALDLLADMLRPSLREEDFQTEKQVILEEIALYQDRPQYRLYEKLMAAHFGKHALGQSVLGTPESIQALTRGDMATYFKHRYSPENVTLVGVGCLDWNAFAAQAEQACAHWVPFEARRNTPHTVGTKTATLVRDEKLLQQHIGMMSAAPSAQDESRYAANVLATILGDVTGSRLFYALVEPGLAEEASCMYEPFDGTGAMLTFICTDPALAAEALQIARAEYVKFVAEGPSEAELVAAKNKIASAATLKGELPMGRLTAVGSDWVYRQDYRPLPEHIERILAIIGEEVHSLARRDSPADATVLSLGPNESLDN